MESGGIVGLCFAAIGGLVYKDPQMVMKNCTRRNVVVVLILFLLWQNAMSLQQFVPGLTFDVTVPALPTAQEKRRKVILIGPHDRFNFGDLLFEKVVNELLVTRAGYQQDDMISTGLIAVNMSKYGGTPRIFSRGQAV
jgi:hypothetical protein